MTSKVQGTKSSKQNVQGSNKFCPDNIIKRLPSIAVHKNTLTYFANKFKEYEEEQEAFKSRLQKYERIYEARHSLESEMHKRRDKMAILQNALSQLQSCFYLGREQNQKLQNEIDKLKMEGDETHKKIFRLLQLTKGQKLHDDIVYIFNELASLHVRHKMLFSKSQDEEQTAVKGFIEEDTPHSLNQQTHDVLESMKKQNESLQRMLEKQLELSQQRVEATVQDCHVVLKEAESFNKYDREKIQQLTDRLKEVETELMSVNTELLNLRKDLRREEVLREMQKNILLNHITEAINFMSPNDTVESIISKICKVIESAFELFESVETHDISGCFKQDPCDSSCQTKNTINLDIYPSKVYSETRSRSLENMSNRMDNKPLENSNSQLQHVDSTGQFIHYSADGDHCNRPHKSPDSHNLARCVSFNSVSPDHNKENFPEGNEFASHSALQPQPHSCLKGTDFLSVKNTTRKSAEKVPECKSQFDVVRPKTADPRRRKPPQKAILRPQSVNQNIYSDKLKRDNILSGHSVSNNTPRNKIGGIPKAIPPKNGFGKDVSKPKSSFVPFPRNNSYKQPPRQVSAPSKRVELKTKPVHHSSEKIIQCNLDEHDSFALNYQNDRYESSENVISKTVGHFAPKIHRNVHVSADLPPRVTQVHHNSKRNSSLFSKDSALETLVKTHNLHQTKQLDAFSLSSHKYCDGMIDNLRETIKNTNLELQEIHSRFARSQIQIQAYEDRCAALERELSFERNEHEVLDAQQKRQNDTLMEQLRITKSRLNKLERYRHLEVDGFRTDIKLLTQKIREMEKQLYKTLLLYEAGGRDMEFLETVHSTTKKSMHISNDVLRLKAKLYQLESALKQL